MRKRINSITAVVLACCLAVCGINVTAADKGKVTVGDISGKPGDTVEVTVNLPQNPGIVSLYLGIEYDQEVLKLNSASDAGLLPDYMAGLVSNYPFAISWESASAVENLTGTGTLATLSFTISEEAEPGEYEITVGQYTNNTPYDVDLNDVDFIYQPGTITVEVPEHEHVFGEWAETKQATCTEAGEKERACTVTGCTEKETQLVEALGHDYGEWETIAEATILDDGREERTCSRCGHVESREIPRIEHGENDHVYDGSSEILEEPDCTHEGKRRTYCSVEGCTAYKETVIAALGHTEGEWEVTKEAACTEDGQREKRCTVCQEILETEIIKAEGHTFRDWTVIQEAAIGQEGLKSRTCSVCGATEEQSIPAVSHGENDHIFAGSKEVVKEPTCTESGIQRVYCSFVGCTAYTETEIPAKGHVEEAWKVEKEPSCTEDGCRVKYCSVCGQKIAEETWEATGHICGEWEVTEEPDCTKNGLKEQYCTVCGEKTGEEYIPALGHDYGDWKTVTEAAIHKDGEEERTCSRCGQTETRVIPAIIHGESDHTFNGKTEIMKEADCEQEGILRVYCSFDGCDAYQDTPMAAKGHVPGEWITVKEPDCMQDGEKEVYCSVCGKWLESITIPAKGHTYSDWETVKEATFQEDGLQKRVCEVCGDELEAVIPKGSESHEHDFSGEEMVLREASCTEPGLAGIRCSNPECDAVKEVETAAKGHTFGEWTVVKEAAVGVEGLKERTCTACGEVEQSKIQPLKKASSNQEQSINITNAAVQTGDSASVYMLFIIMIIAFATAAGLSVFRRRWKVAK